VRDYKSQIFLRHPKTWFRNQDSFGTSFSVHRLGIEYLADLVFIKKDECVGMTERVCE